MFSEERAQYAVNFIERFCTHTTGEWAGKPFKLLDWQKKIVREVFGTLKPDGFRQYNTVYIEIPKKNGKALALDTKIPTPSGYKRLGDLKSGDIIFDENGNQCTVIAVGPVLKDRPCYRLTFCDGAKIIADAKHEWLVDHPYWTAGYRLRETESLIDKTGYRFPCAKATQCDDVDLPIPPYTLGVWLGDGSSANASFTCHYKDTEIIDNVIKDGIQVREWKSSNKNSGHFAFGDGDRSNRANCWQLKFKSLNIISNKHIPEIYLRASHGQRLALLQGLMDTDGYCSKVGQCEFTTTKEQLCHGVIELIRSLGYKCTYHKKTAYLNGKDCGDKYRIQFWAYNGDPIFRLTRKYNRQKAVHGNTRNSRHFLKTIERIESVPVRCIQVDSPSGLFLASDSFIPTHNSELGGAIALYLLIADKEPGAQVYSAASDRDQAGIVYGVAAGMVDNSRDLAAIAKVIDSTKRIITKDGIYHVLSSEAFTKHGYNISGVVFDELHTQPNRELYDVLTKGSGFARKQPLYWLMTTAGTDRNSICWEVHQKAEQILKGIIEDPTFYPVIYTLEDTEDWESEENWYKVNPSLGYIIDIEKFRNAHRDAVNNLADENTFRQLHLDQWVTSVSRWIPLRFWDACDKEFKSLEGRDCYAGLDLSSTTDLTALCIASQDGEDFDTEFHAWIPADTAAEKERTDKVPYRKWAKEGFITLTPGNVIDYAFIIEKIKELSQKYHIKELAYDRWGASKIIQDLETEGIVTADPKGSGIVLVPFGQGFKDMSPATKDLEVAIRAGHIRHGGNPVARWNVDNMVVTTDAAENVKPHKAKATQRIDLCVAMIMALDRAMKHKDAGPSIYETRGF